MMYICPKCGNSNQNTITEFKYDDAKDSSKGCQCLNCGFIGDVGSFEVSDREYVEKVISC